MDFDIDPSRSSARRRALAGTSARISQLLIQPEMGSAAIPVDATGWQSVLDDTQLPRAVGDLVRGLDRVRVLDVNDPVVIGKALRRELATAVDSLQRVADGTEQASWFQPPEGLSSNQDVLVQILVDARMAMSACVDLLTGTDGASQSTLADACDRLTKGRAQLAAPKADDGEDPFERAFGFPVARLVGQRGLIESSRIRALFAKRPQELETIGRRLLRALLPDATTHAPNAALFGGALVGNERPLVCHQVARYTTARLMTTFAADSNVAVRTIERMLRGLNSSASTHFQGLAPAAARMKAATTDSERARVVVEQYRLISEGTLRPTGWAILELGGAVRAKVPGLAEVRDLLLAEGSPLALLVAQGIRPEWRNPGAHEDHYWDAVRQLVVLGDRTATIDEVSAATGYAISVMHGFETAIACARLRLPALADRLSAVLLDASPALVDMRVRDALARNGFLVWDAVWHRDHVEVVVDEANFGAEIHLLLAGLLDAHLEAPTVRRWDVRIRDGGKPGIVITVGALEAATTLLPKDPTTRRIEVNVLLPLIASAKLGCGVSAANVEEDATVLALKHPLWLAQDEAHQIIERRPDSIHRLVVALDLAARALATTLRLTGTANEVSVADLLIAARDAANDWGSGRGEFTAVESRLNQLLDTYHALPQRPLLGG